MRSYWSVKIYNQSKFDLLIEMGLNIRDLFCLVTYMVTKDEVFF